MLTLQSMFSLNTTLRSTSNKRNQLTQDATQLSAHRFLKTTSEHDSK